MRDSTCESATTGYTVANVAARYRVGLHKVLAWIARGELLAVNVASTASRRPRWLILPEHLQDFERRRSAQPIARTRRRKSKPDATIAPGNVIEFY